MLHYVQLRVLTVPGAVEVVEERGFDLGPAVLFIRSARAGGCAVMTTALGGAVAAAARTGLIRENILKVQHSV